MSYYLGSYPVPSDYFGVLWALAGIKDGIVVEHGAPGTMAYNAVNFKMLGQMEPLGRFFTSGMDEDDVIMGREDKLISAIREVDRLYQPKLISIAATGVTSVIGLDLEGIASELQEAVSADILVFSGGGFKGDYLSGKEEAFFSVAERLVKEPAVIEKRIVNILGVSADDFNHVSDIAEIKRLLNKQGINVHTIFPLDTDTKAIENMSRAGLNIVLYDTGIKTAEMLENRFGTPWLYGMPFGIKGTVDWLDGIEKKTGISLDRALIAEDMKVYGQTIRSLTAKQPVNGVGVGISGSNEYTAGLADFIQNECGLPVKVAALKKTPSLESANQHLKQLNVAAVLVAPAHSELIAELKTHDIQVLFGNSYELNSVSSGSS